MKRTIMIIDDDVHIGNMLEETLRLEGYDVLRAYSGTEALMVLKDQKPDLILLDLMLPGISGEELLAEIENIPVIVVSAKTMVDTKVQMLMDGAADYVTKPFEINELLARIVVQLRKTEQTTVPACGENIISAGGVLLDMDLRTAEIDGEKIPLTRTECAILKILMQNEGLPIGRNTILDRICMDTPDCTERSLKQHISNIRKKLQAVSGVDYIEAIYGIGFKFQS